MQSAHILAHVLVMPAAPSGQHLLVPDTDLAQWYSGAGVASVCQPAIVLFIWQDAGSSIRTRENTPPKTKQCQKEKILATVIWMLEGSDELAYSTLIV